MSVNDNNKYLIVKPILNKDGCYIAQEVIDSIPSADVEPVRHGRWVESYKSNAAPTLRSRWTCSWCGNVQTYGATDYCPNCGARMDGGENEID